MRAQYAWKSLLSFEQFAAGNYTVGRGYDPGAIIGDRGFGTQLEMRYGSRIGQSARKPAIEGYAFWDHAAVHNRNELVVTPGRKRLDSVGAGARIAEIPIKNPPRQNGKSNYGLSRAFRVFLDLLSTKFLLDYSTRPLHFFGFFGLLATGTGTVMASFLLLKKLVLHQAVMLQNGPLLFAATVFILAGIQLVCLGLAVMQRVRAVFDPEGLCNPGKVFPTPRLCGEVPGPYRAHPVETAGLAERM